MRPLHRLAVVLTVLSSGTAGAAGAAPSAAREIVVANEVLAAGGKYLDGNLDAFLRRIEQVTGWPSGSLRGKAFARPREALDHVRKTRPAFAILPVHQYVELRKELKLEVIGRAVGLEGTTIAYWGVTISGKPTFGRIDETPGLRLAVTETYDNQWLRVLMDGNVKDPITHFKLVEVPSQQEALAAVLAKRADVALVYELEFQPIKARIEAGKDYRWIYTSGPLPPPPIVATKFASRGDRKRLADALAKLCKMDGADACGRMGIQYVEAGRAETYRVIIDRYDNWR